ncbi:peptidylprolyl isomerase [Opitutus terrae]|uniref:PpiC-type peptidyl-prolyl cis-trans isomerase n=1 Tax=Opitutus terrae (strain DSM 11246 / JCM 15787 / PB90-1) TaxID=452637 RepID=B1ZYU6_OPITP|nr:peptidylprolyl isomerase [Opitutus terrae]ACB76269.1 PpiC-type peptidyl-prolyl cis-trans isomerase [Opitutus terrae PB90-1]
MMIGRFRFALLSLLLAVPLAAQEAGDNLNLRFANGIAAIVEDKVITVDDVRREIAPLIAQLQREARNEREFNEKLEQLQDDVIQSLIDRVLIVKEFRKDEKKHIPDSFIDNRLADILSEQFDNDRSKFLAYLHSRGTTLREYRREVEEDIIYQYMRQEQRKSQSIVSPVRIETFYNENKDRFYQEDGVHLRLIQFSRANGETDEDLRAKANLVMARIKAGEKFEDLAREYSQDSRRAKGGDWGWQKRSDLKPEFSEPLFSLKKGEVSDPIILPEGCFILFAEDRKYAGIQPIDEVRDEIERVLVQQMSRNSQEHWLERLRRNGYVKHY